MMYNNRTRKLKGGVSFAGYDYNISNKISNLGKGLANNATSKNLMNSAKNLANSKYFVTLITNPANTHRILFKAAHYIEFLDENNIKKLYCTSENMNCIKIYENHLYSNNEIIVNDANNFENSVISKQIKNENISETEKKDIKNVEEALMNDDILEDKSVYSELSNSLKRLDFAKLNDALITDNYELSNNPNNNYISFKKDLSPAFFEFFQTYKYQIHRTLWSGGWNDWTFIVNEMRNYIQNNSSVSQKYTDELWGTFGGLKLIFGKTNPKTLKKLIADTNSNIQDQSIIQLDKDGENKSKTQSNEKDDDEIEQKKSSYTRNVRSMADTVGNTIGSKLGTNISKYRVIRKLLKYYDIDAGKYNMNVLKMTGILTKNYPLFMEREAKRAIKIAIFNLKNNKNTKIINVSIEEEPIDDDTLDNLLNKLMVYNLDTKDIMELKGGRKTKHKKYSRKRVKRNTKRVKRFKMSGGSMLFFYNLNIIFKETYHQMVREQLKNLFDFSTIDAKNVDILGRFLAQLTRDTCAMSMTLCLTLLNYALWMTPVGQSPHCVLTNVMFVYFLYKMRILDKSNINIVDKIYNTNASTAVHTTLNAVPGTYPDQNNNNSR